MTTPAQVVALVQEIVRTTPPVAPETAIKSRAFAPQRTNVPPSPDTNAMQAALKACGLLADAFGSLLPITPLPGVVFVAATAPSGGNGSITAPFNTINAAAAVAVPTNQAIVVASGTYDEQLDISSGNLRLIGVGDVVLRSTSPSGATLRLRADCRGAQVENVTIRQLSDTVGAAALRIDGVGATPNFLENFATFNRCNLQVGAGLFPVAGLALDINLTVFPALAYRIDISSTLVANTGGVSVNVIPGALVNFDSVLWFPSTWDVSGGGSFNLNGAFILGAPCNFNMSGTATLFSALVQSINSTGSPILVAADCVSQNPPNTGAILRSASLRTTDTLSAPLVVGPVAAAGGVVDFTVAAPGFMFDVNQATVLPDGTTASYDLAFYNSAANRAAGSVPPSLGDTGIVAAFSGITTSAVVATLARFIAQGARGAEDGLTIFGRGINNDPVNPRNFAVGVQLYERLT